MMKQRDKAVFIIEKLQSQINAKRRLQSIHKCLPLNKIVHSIRRQATANLLLKNIYIVNVVLMKQFLSSVLQWKQQNFLPSILENGVFLRENNILKRII